VFPERDGLDRRRTRPAARGVVRTQITHAEDADKGAHIEALVVKLGGDPDTALFGAYSHVDGEPPVPEYPADDTDEG
jgi:hypothetical protein